MDSNPALGLIGFWMMLQLAATLAILVGGIYALYCLGRASAGLDRMASALEEWVAQHNATNASPPPRSLPDLLRAQPFTPSASAAPPPPSPAELSHPDESNS
jgi:hypothetical protein